MSQIATVKGQGGFTFMEVMVALAITAGVVTALVVSFNYHLGASSRTRDEVISSVLGAKKLEDIRIEGITEREGVFEGFEGLSWRLVEEDSGMEGVKRIELIVTGKEGQAISFVSFREG